MVLLFMRDRELRLCGGLSTVTRRWRPTAVRGSRGALKWGQRRGERGQGQVEDDAWKMTQQEVALWRRQSGGQE
jgi:hypothetical protein